MSLRVRHAIVIHSPSFRVCVNVFFLAPASTLARLPLVYIFDILVAVAIVVVVVAIVVVDGGVVVGCINVYFRTIIRFAQIVRNIDCCARERNAIVYLKKRTKSTIHFFHFFAVYSISCSLTRILSSPPLLRLPLSLAFCFKIVSSLVLHVCSRVKNKICTHQEN